MSKKKNDMHSVNDLRNGNFDHDDHSSDKSTKDGSHDKKSDRD